MNGQSLFLSVSQTNFNICVQEHASKCRVTVRPVQAGTPRISLFGWHTTQWLRGRASDSKQREPGFESCAAVLKPWASFFTPCCSSSLSCINEYLAIDSGDYVYEQPFAH